MFKTSGFAFKHPVYQLSGMTNVNGWIFTFNQSLKEKGIKKPNNTWNICMFANWTVDKWGTECISWELVELANIQNLRILKLPSKNIFISVRDNSKNTVFHVDPVHRNQRITSERLNLSSLVILYNFSK